MTESSSKAPYSAGTLSEDTLNNALQVLNACRYIAGLNAVELNDSKS